MVSHTLLNIEEKMKKSVEASRRELATIRTGRATPALIEYIKVEYTGAILPLNQLASISAPEAKLLIVQPWDKGTINLIEKAILASHLGITPVNDGDIIRITLPEMSSQRRDELGKILGKKA